MDVVDFILNLAGILLWINWRSILHDPFEKRTPATLVGALKRAAPSRFRPWHLLAVIGLLLILRALLYRLIGPAVSWSGSLDLGAAVIFFRSNIFPQILLFSILSFARLFCIFYLWLLMLSILSGPMPVHRFIKVQLGAIDGWTTKIKFILPFFVVSVSWWLISWPLVWSKIIPQPISVVRQILDSLTVGLGGYLAWKYLIVGLLGLYLLSSYVYFGKHPFWKYLEAVATALLKPIKWIPLRTGKMDFSPVAGIAITFLIAQGLEWSLVKFYSWLSS